MIADLLTLGNLISGFIAITYMLDGRLTLAAIFLVLAGIFDGLDGPAARRFGSSHKLGVWLDSIGDAVSFGIAPALLVYAHFFTGNWSDEPIRNLSTLIVAGTILLMLFEHCSPQQEHYSGFKTALFQSITARTAGFNTVNIGLLSEASKMIIMMLMFIGGSPGSTAGGIKTVTLALVVMVIYATLRKRREVELFKRSIRMVVVGRAITVMLLFAGLLILMTMLLVLSECGRGWSLLDLAFETASALGTVGLSTGVTPTLTMAGKWIIIATMLIGRLGPLTLLVGLTFNLKPESYDYPSEPLMVG